MTVEYVDIQVTCSCALCPPYFAGDSASVGAATHPTPIGEVRVVGEAAEPSGSRVGQPDVEMGGLRAGGAIADPNGARVGRGDALVGGARTRGMGAKTGAMPIE